MQNQENFNEAEQLIEKLEQHGFTIKPKYDVNIEGKRVITILPRKKCLFRYTGILLSGKLVTTTNKKEIDLLFNSLLEFKGEMHE